jgi:hypothetical protein
MFPTNHSAVCFNFFAVFVEIFLIYDDYCRLYNNFDIARFTAERQNNVRIGTRTTGSRDFQKTHLFLDDERYHSPLPLEVCRNTMPPRKEKE